MCRGHKSGNRGIHDYRCLFRHADGERKPSASSKIRRYSRSSCYSEGKITSKVVYLKTESQWILFYRKLKTWDWTLRRDTPKNYQDAPGRKLNSGKKQAIWRHYPKRWTSWAKSLRARFWGTTTRGNLTTSRLYQQSSVECGEKIRKLKAEDNYVLFSCEGARDTEDRMLVVDSGASKHNAEQERERFTLRWNGYFEKVQNHQERLTAIGSSANKRVSTSFCPWSRSVRNSATTRWNASNSIASPALLKTRNISMSW